MYIQRFLCIAIAASAHLFAALAIMSASMAWGETVCYFSGGTRSGNSYTKGPYIDIGKKYPLADSLSMSAWVRVSPNITTVKPYGNIYYGAAIAGQGFYGGENGFGFLTGGFNSDDPSDDYLGYQVRIQSGSPVLTSDSYKTNTLFTADEWHHYLVVRDKTSGTARFYVDGNLFSEKDCPSSWDLTATKNFAIAYNPVGNGGSFCGYIADIALWDVALSATDAARLPSVGANGVSVAPIAYFPLNEGSGNTVSETVNNTSHTATGGNLVWVDDPNFSRFNDGCLNVTSSPAGVGSPSPAYGVTNGLSAGESFAVSCGQAVWTNATRFIAYSCTGWKLYDESDAVISNGVETSFTYTHPNPAAYRTLEWQWEAIQLPLPSLYDVTTLWAGTATNYSANAAGVGYAGFMAFDNKSKTDSYSRWITTKSANMYVIYTFHEATPVDALGVFINTATSRAPKNWTFEGSNDNSTWTTLDTQTDETGWSAYEFRYYKFENDTPYKYYKFNCTANNGASDSMEVQELEFYYSQSIPPTGGEVDLTTSAAGYVNGQSGNYAGYKADNAFDNFGNKSRSDSESRWLAAKSSNMYAIYRFYRRTAVDAIGIYLTADSTGRAPKDWTFSGSNDKSTWTTLDTRTNETGWKQSEFRYYKFANDTPYTYYRFSCTANNGDSNCMGIQEIEFYHSSSGPGTARWTGAGETDLLTDARNWNPALPRWATAAYIDDTGATPAVVPAGEMVYSGLVVGNGSGKCAKLAQTNGTIRLLDSVLTIGRDSGVGEYCLAGGTLETKGMVGGNGVATAEFDGGTLRASAKNVSFLKDIASVRLKDGGVAIDTEGYGLGITNCTFCVSSGGKITAVGGGKVTFTDVTITLAAGSSCAITFAERTDDGVFEGVPILNARGYKLRISDDNKSIRIIPPGFMLVVR